MQKFCFVCGAQTQELIEGYCNDCFEKVPAARVPEKISLTSCSRCGSVKTGSRWIKLELCDILKKQIKILGKLKNLKTKEHDKKIEIFLEIESGGKMKKEVYTINFHKNKGLCSKCAKKFSDYYESILQLREFERKDLLKLKSLNQFRCKEVKGGMDIYIESKSLAKAAAKKIQTIIPVEIKESFRVWGKKNGKNVYRKIISIRKIDMSESNGRSH